MGSLFSKNKGEEIETPVRESTVKRIEDPRSPTDDINRTPIEVTDKQPKESFRHLAFANALKGQNKIMYESSPICQRTDMPDENDMMKQRYHSLSLDCIPILRAEDSGTSFNISAIETENDK